MLSIAKLRVGAEAYQLTGVAQSLDDYYSGAGEAAGWWAGTGATVLGLDGEVAGDDLRAVLAGMQPGTGGLSPNNETIRPHPRRVPGFDLTFKAPKSASVLYAISDDPRVQGAIIDASEAALRDTLGWVEREVMAVRRGSDDRRYLANSRPRDRGGESHPRGTRRGPRRRSVPAPHLTRRRSAAALARPDPEHGPRRRRPLVSVRAPRPLPPPARRRGGLPSRATRRARPSGSESSGAPAVTSPRSPGSPKPYWIRSRSVPPRSTPGSTTTTAATTPHRANKQCSPPAEARPRWKTNASISAGNSKAPPSASAPNTPKPSLPNAIPSRPGTRRCGALPELSVGADGAPSTQAQTTSVEGWIADLLCTDLVTRDATFTVADLYQAVARRLGDGATVRHHRPCRRSPCSPPSRSSPSPRDCGATPLPGGHRDHGRHRTTTPRHLRPPRHPPPDPHHPPRTGTDHSQDPGRRPEPRQ